jgi:hypothetical protein
MNAKTALFGLTVLLFAACSPTLTTFTRDIYTEQNLSDSDLKQIQFFLSEDLVLYRYLDEKGNFEINDGSLRIKNGRKTQEVVIKAGTPGVFISRPKEDLFAISFESGDDSRYLMFGPNPKNGGIYELRASEWKKRTGVVTYANEKFEVYSDYIPRLMVDLKKSRTDKYERTRAGGRKVGTK